MAQDTPTATKFATRTFVLPAKLEVVVLTEHGLAEFLSPQNLLWLQKDGNANIVTWSELREWEVKMLSPTRPASKLMFVLLVLRQKRSVLLI